MAHLYQQNSNSFNEQYIMYYPKLHIISNDYILGLIWFKC